MKEGAVKILIVDPSRRDRRIIRGILEGRMASECAEAATLADAGGILSGGGADVVFAADPKDEDEAPSMEGFLREAARRPGGAPVILYDGGKPNQRRVQRMLSAGAFGYLYRPFQLEELAETIHRAAYLRSAGVAPKAEGDAAAAWLDALFEDLRTHLAKAQYSDSR